MRPDGPVRVALAFVAHAPVCAPRRLAASPVGRLPSVAEGLGAPVLLAASNELWHQLARDLPATFAELERGFGDGRLRALVTPAHHTPTALLTPAELVDELRLNDELVQRLPAPPESRRGVLFTDCVVDAGHVAAVEEAGWDFTLCAPARGADPHRPFRLGERLLALPLQPMELTAELESSVAVLARFVDAAPPGAAVAVLHDVRDVEVARWAWARLREERPGAFSLVAASELVEALTPPWVERVAFDRLAPDGVLAAPLAAGEQARFAAAALGWLVDAFGFERTAPVHAKTLTDEDYDLATLPPRAQVPLRLRLVKAGCALDANEALSRRPYQHAAALCELLQAECRLADVQPRPDGALPPFALPGLRRMAEWVVDPRLAYRRVELEEREARGDETSAAWAALGEAHVARQRADAALAQAEEAYAALQPPTSAGRNRWRALLTALWAHFLAVCDALEALALTATVPSPAESRAAG